MDSLLNKTNGIIDVMKKVVGIILGLVLIAALIASGIYEKNRGNIRRFQNE